MCTETNTYDKLNACLHRCINIVQGGSLPHIQEMLYESVDRLSQPMQLAVIGKISSSKSTLVNAILGEAEIVRTGQMEETFNVSWLKYGDSNSDIKIVFKTGDVKYVPRHEWTHWTSHQKKNTLKEDVKYIEVTYQHDILKQINIIDTPGLDALSGIDSQNTISFLGEVKPDAVIVMFTKSIAESTFSILQNFQNSSSGKFTLNPINAIGVLAKADTIWSVMNMDANVIEEGKKVITHTLYGKYPEVKKALFSILPACSLLGLAASTLDQYDVDILKELCHLDESLLFEMLCSSELFCNEEYSISITKEQRNNIYAKLGLYGIHLLTKELQMHPDIDLVQMQSILNKESGFKQLLKTLKSHFGDRATLIKSQNYVQQIINECEKSKTLGCSTDDILRLDQVCTEIITTTLSIHEYQEWRYLSQIYSGDIDGYDENVIDEFKAICGENGGAFVNKLRLSNENTVEQFITKITDRALYWQKQYNIYSLIEPKKAGLYKIMLSTYNNMHKQVDYIYNNVKSAESILKQSEILLFGDLNK